MKPVSLLTKSIKNSEYSTHLLQQVNVPHRYSENIKNISESYKVKPSKVGDGKDWAREVMQNQSRHHEIAVKWAKQVLKGE